MKSKLDIYNILAKEGQLYLPPYNECPMTFIKDVMTGKKKVFSRAQIRMIDVPYFDELAGKKVFEMIRDRVRFQQYLPDLDALSRPLNRQYMFNVSLKN
jgi:hypothetical protein